MAMVSIVRDLFKDSAVRHSEKLISSLDVGLSRRKLRPRTFSIRSRSQDILGDELARVRKRLSKLSTDIFPGEVSRFIVPLLEADVPLQLLNVFEIVSFEAKKDIAYILNFILRVADPPKLVEGIKVYFSGRSPSFIRSLFKLYKNPDCAIHCGIILQNCFAITCLYGECFRNDFAFLDQFMENLVLSPSFEVSSDAFTTFEKLLTYDSKFVATFLDKNFETFNPKFAKLLSSDHYFIQRRSLGLLKKLLLKTENFEYRMKFLDDRENLIHIMKLMCEESQWIRSDAFGVFKIFVANPYKSDQVQIVLAKNKEKLEKYYSEAEFDSFNSQESK